ncbi:MAG: SRPBCC family protein [Actinomycetota bacterium]
MTSALTVTRTVDAPIEAVWAVATDLENVPRTMSGIVRVEVLDGGPSVDDGPSFGVGTRWRETRTMMGRDATEEMVVTRADRPNAYTVEADNHGAHYVSTFTFTPVGESRTELSTTFGGTPTQPQNALSRLMGRLGLRMVRKSLEKDLADLATAAESRRRGA